ncbi:hypothetical protein Pfo_020303 [Paulownia fortunei]|nr:hypothetical protein Pfo_020303 [Paulownia fortunei]
MPPPFRRLPSRPKKLRKKRADEIADGTRITRKGRIISCTNCGNTEHNRKTCKRPLMENPTLAHQIIAILESGTYIPIELTVGESGTKRRESTRVRDRPRGRVRGRRAGREKGKERYRGNGPEYGFVNWNGLGFSNMTHFKLATQVYLTSFAKKGISITKILMTSAKAKKETS